jgi:hypothetical protein
MGQHQVYAGELGGSSGVDRHDPRVRMRATEHLEMQHGWIGYGGFVEGVALGPGHDPYAGWRRHRCAVRLAGLRRGGVELAGKSVADRPVAGAPAQVALQQPRQVCRLSTCDCRRGDDHPGGAEPALKPSGVDEGLLQRVQVPRRPESRDGGDFATFGSRRRNDA